MCDELKWNFRLFPAPIEIQPLYLVASALYQPTYRIGDYKAHTSRAHRHEMNGSKIEDFFFRMTTNKQLHVAL
jgi:hypothetical protein